jgi:protein associated with RNAse G/E
MKQKFTYEELWEKYIIADSMAQCTLMLHDDLVQLGIIDKSIAPMFMTEAILNYINKSQKSKVMKDHEIRELVNEVTEVAKEYANTQQLRERISMAVKEHLEKIDG